VRAIPKGYKWEEVGADLLSWLKANHTRAPMEGEASFIVDVASTSKLGALQLPIILQSIHMPGWSEASGARRRSALP
jgi:hypothetical protein